MTQEQEKSSRCPRWVKIALAVSLAVNLLIVGLVGGVAFSGGKVGPLRVTDAGGAYTQALTPKDRRAIGQAIARELQGQRKDRASVLAEYQGMLDVLRAEPFDREAAAQVLLRQTRIFEQRRSASETALLDRLEGMTAAERAAFVERLEEGIRKQRRPGQ